MNHNEQPIPTAWSAAALGVLALSFAFAPMAISACSEAQAAPNAMREVQSVRVLCSEISVDAGWTATQVTCGAGGFSTIACTNPLSSTNTVYVGGSDVTTANGFPVCSTAAGASGCGGSNIAMDTSQGQVYCTTNTSSADGGTPIKCLCGW